jgi:hypothetical protein
LSSAPAISPQQTAAAVRAALPAGGLFAGQTWRVAPAPLPLGDKLAQELDSLGRVLLQFYRAVNLLHRQSLAGKQPPWAAQWLDQGKPAELLELQRDPALKNELPRVIRPDILLTETGFAITELDSVPGGIGLTAWLNQTYSQLGTQNSERGTAKIIGGADGMLRGFAGIFGEAPRVHLVVSEESASYRPEMEWLAAQLGGSKFKVQSSKFDSFSDGDAVYRFFELFDMANVPCAPLLFAAARAGRLRLTPPPRPMFEEKMLFALLWNRNLAGFWRQQLGEGFFNLLQQHVPYTWLVNPAPLPPHGAIPELNLTDWHQLKTLSQRARELILKVSGYSEQAWGARGVHLGSDLSQGDWSAAVDEALASFPRSPYVLQRFHKPRTVDAEWFDFERNVVTPMKGRVRLCPYYFVHGDGEAARPHLGGVLATIVPVDKKIVHGMSEAIMAPCSV